MKGYRIRVLIYVFCLLLCTAVSAIVANIFFDSIILVMLVSCAIGLTIGALSAGIVTRPLADLSLQISALKKGDLSKSSKRFNLPIQKELDETIEYINFVVSDTANVLKEVAQGNLAANPSKKYRGDFKMLQSSLRYVVEALNANISDMACSVSSASSYSNQIHDTAKQLADNSTEQAIAIANLSQSMALVAERAIHSTKLAHSMVESGEGVKQLAIIGAEQMNSMMQAVQEINDAGKSIEGVIKIIEDIAFQTNILALNAAVEAARAGQHGKGFAVVADEVRQLAGKSSVAAQKTNELISDTMKKAEEGYNISLETRNSLEQILTGIQSVTDSIVEISKGSDTQEQEIKTVNSLLEDQAVAVQQSSSSSKTTAAYGQSINENVDGIQQMINCFRLNDSGNEKVKNNIMHIEGFKPGNLHNDGDDSSIYKKLLWDDSLKMGDEAIDDQHKQLIEMVDHLLASCFNGTGADEINKAMNFLLEYTVKHFADEEELQKSCSYPEYTRHKQIHDAFAAKAVGLAKELEKQGPTPEMIGLINKELVGWLLNHINGEDKKISRYLGNNA